MSSWTTEIGAIVRKEVLSETRTKSGIVTVGLFSFAAVFAVAFAAFGQKLTGSLASGLLWVTLLFASTVALPRAFLAEEEQGTSDLLRLSARPHAVFWGKAIYNLGFILISALALSLVFFVLVNVPINDPLLYLICLAGGCTALAATGTLSGALVAQASNRSALAAAISVPLLLPLIAIGVAGMRVALGEGLPENGYKAALGILCYGVASLTIGPQLFAAIWRN